MSPAVILATHAAAAAIAYAFGRRSVSRDPAARERERLRRLWLARPGPLPMPPAPPRTPPDAGKMRYVPLRRG